MREKCGPDETPDSNKYNFTHLTPMFYFILPESVRKPELPPAALLKVALLHGWCSSFLFVKVIPNLVKRLIWLGFAFVLPVQYDFKSTVCRWELITTNTKLASKIQLTFNQMLIFRSTWSTSVVIICATMKNATWTCQMHNCIWNT